MSDVVAALKLSSDQTTSNVNPPGTVSALEADQSALDVEPGKAYLFYKCVKRETFLFKRIVEAYLTWLYLVCDGFR